MKKQLFIKFLLGYSLFFLLSFLFVFFYGGNRLYSSIYHAEGRALYREVTRLSTFYSKEENGALSIEGILKEMEGNIHYRGVEWMLLSPGGEILAYQGAENLRAKSIPSFNATEYAKKTYYTEDFQGLFKEKRLLARAPVQRSFRTVAYFYLLLPLSEIEEKKAETMQIFLMGLLFVFLFSFSIFWVFYIFVYRPLKKITSGAVHYASGEYDYRIVVAGRDEMRYLAETLNYMAEEIAKGDDYQRQFIANISHDFRSPLTSIKGYLEAMLDGTIPRDMEEKYLERVISETERLSKLTQSMLSLNRLDTDCSLMRSNFDINRMIRGVCNSFEMQCAKKSLQFSLIFAEKKEMVFADYPKIQQVLYNLIDNAVKFSREGTEIFVRTEERGAKVFIAVKDQGIGIPKKDVQKIWERFYKTDLSRGKDKGGTGLGLSIVKGILTAHQEHIDCVSTEGVGTEFSFSLPMPLKEEA